MRRVFLPVCSCLRVWTVLGMLLGQGLSPSSCSTELRSGLLVRVLEVMYIYVYGPSLNRLRHG